MGIRIRDVDDNIWYANPAFLNIFGYDNIEESKISPPQHIIRRKNITNICNARRNHLTVNQSPKN